jgi:A/G-specific adenine glycosylase
MAAERVDLARARRLRAPILRWYGKAKRDLPWRRSVDPYAIWVSEVMLQQTTVAAVVPYWQRFLDRFPDAASLARLARTTCWRCGAASGTTGAREPCAMERSR